MIKSWQKFNESSSWKEFIPDSLTLKKGNTIATYKKGNIVQNSGMINLMYTLEEDSLQAFMKLLSNLSKSNLSRQDFNFLDTDPNSYIPPK